MDAKLYTEEEDERWVRATLYLRRRTYRYTDRPARHWFGWVVHVLRMWREK